MINGITLTLSGSPGAAGTSRFPFTPRPSTTAEMASALGAVARITRAPPSFCNSATVSAAPESMYWCAPSFLANDIRVCGHCDDMLARTQDRIVALIIPEIRNLDAVDE